MSLRPDSEFSIDSNGVPRSFRAIANNNPTTDGARTSRFLITPQNLNNFSEVDLTDNERQVVSTFYNSYPSTLSWSLNDSNIAVLRQAYTKITGSSGNQLSAEDMYVSLQYRFNSMYTQRDTGTSNLNGSLNNSRFTRNDVENANVNAVYLNTNPETSAEATIRAANRFANNTQLLFFPDELMNGDIQSRSFYGNRVMNFIRFDILQTIGGGINTNSSQGNNAANQWNNLNIPIETRDLLVKTVLGGAGGAIAGKLLFGSGAGGGAIGAAIGAGFSLPDGTISNEISAFSELAQAAISGDPQSIENLNNYLKNPEKTSVLGAIYAIATDTSTISDRVTKNPIASILMYCPQDIRSEHNMQYSDTDLSTASRISEILNTAFNKNAAMSGELIKLLGVNAANELLSGLNDGTFAKILGGEGFDLNKIIAAKTRQVPMPNMEYLFQQVNRRNFGFDFDLYPKSPREVKNAKEILRLFQKHSHPRLSDAGRYYIMPDVFRISFMTFDDSGQLIYNTALPIYKLCACNGVSINYTAPGELSTLDKVETDENGKKYRMPLGIRLSLNFTELELLHQKDFEKTTMSEVQRSVMGQNTFQGIIDNIG